MENKKLINGILFLKGRTGATVKELASTLKLKQKDVKESLDELILDLQKPSSIYFVKKTEDKYRLTLKDDLALSLSENIDKTINVRLSKSVIEVLAIVAYKQPITKPYIDEIRGVSSDYALRRLLDFDLVEDAGRSDAPGQPKLYVTTIRFLELFNVSSTSELPPLPENLIEELEVVDLFEHD